MRLTIKLIVNRILLTAFLLGFFVLPVLFRFWAHFKRFFAYFKPFFLFVVAIFMAILALKIAIYQTTCWSSFTQHIIQIKLQ
jgi:hypothetical protein